MDGGRKIIVKESLESSSVDANAIRQYHQNQINSRSKLNPRKRKRLKLMMICVPIILILAAGITYYFIEKNHSNNTLPYPISSQTAGLLGYDIYYPNQKLLPPGFNLNKNSFYDSDQAIIYSVSYGNGQKIVFSDQAKPTSAQLQSFYAKNMPLHSTFNTNIGVATLGAINLQSVVSLPTNSNAWLIVTAPGNINQNELRAVINSIEIAK